MPPWLVPAEQKARSAVEARSKMQRELLAREKEKKEKELRELALKARMDRIGGGAAPAAAAAPAAPAGEHREGAAGRQRRSCRARKRGGSYVCGWVPGAGCGGSALRRALLPAGLLGFGLCLCRSVGWAVRTAHLALSLRCTCATWAAISLTTAAGACCLCLQRRWRLVGRACRFQRGARVVCRRG